MNRYTIISSDRNGMELGRVGSDNPRDAQFGLILPGATMTILRNEEIATPDAQAGGD